VTFEEPHVAAYREPQWVERAPADRALLQMLLDGEIDAAIFGNQMPDAPLAPLIPDPALAARQWSERRGVTPLNHMVVVRASIAGPQQECVRGLSRWSRESGNPAARGPGGAAAGFGANPNRRSLELIIDYAFRQQLIPRRFSVDELFDDTTRALGADS